MGKSSGYKNIVRLERDATGWYVRINFKGASYPKFFNDKKHNGKDGALQAAIAWRDEKCREIGKPISERHIVSRHQNNKTGALGVRRFNKKTGTSKAGKFYHSDVFEVTWCPEPNKVKRTSFSVAKWGEEGAYQKALVLRRKHERFMYGGEIGSAETP